MLLVRLLVNRLLVKFRRNQKFYVGCSGAQYPNPTLFRVNSALYDTLMVGTRQHTLAQTHRMKDSSVSPNVNPGPWIITMYQCRFINGGDINSDKSAHAYRQGYMRNPCASGTILL